MDEVTTLPVERLRQPGCGFIENDCRDSNRTGTGKNPAQLADQRGRKPGDCEERRRKEQDKPEQVAGGKSLWNRATPPGPADSVLPGQVNPGDLQNAIKCKSPREQPRRRNGRPTEQVLLSH